MTEREAQLLEACQTAIRGFERLAEYLNTNCEVKLKDGPPMRLRQPMTIVAELRAAVAKVDTRSEAVLFS